MCRKTCGCTCFSIGGSISIVSLLASVGMAALASYTAMVEIQVLLNCRDFFEKWNLSVADTYEGGNRAALSGILAATEAIASDGEWDPY